MTNDETRPLPCPFCGSEDIDPQLVTQERHEPYTVRTGCESCGSSGPEDETLEGAVAAWNAAGDEIKELRADREALRSHLGGILAHFYEFMDQPGVAGIAERMDEADAYLRRDEPSSTPEAR
jgi:Lar family restriction alleviation protein